VLVHGAWADASGWSGHPATAGIPPAELTFVAKRAGAHSTELNAGHLSMIANPETVAQVIEQAATATT
jgi:hypothetical protein